MFNKFIINFYEINELEHRMKVHKKSLKEDFSFDEKISDIYRIAFFKKKDFDIIEENICEDKFESVYNIANLQISYDYHIFYSSDVVAYNDNLTLNDILKFLKNNDSEFSYYIKLKKSNLKINDLLKNGNNKELDLVLEFYKETEEILEIIYILQQFEIDENQYSILKKFSMKNKYNFNLSSHFKKIHLLLIMASEKLFYLKNFYSDSYFEEIIKNESIKSFYLKLKMKYTDFFLKEDDLDINFFVTTPIRKAAYYYIIFLKKIKNLKDFNDIDNIFNIFRKKDNAKNLITQYLNGKKEFTLSLLEKIFIHNKNISIKDRTILIEYFKKANTILHFFPTSNEEKKRESLFKNILEEGINFTFYNIKNNHIDVKLTGSNVPTILKMKPEDFKIDTNINMPLTPRLYLISIIHDVIESKIEEIPNKINLSLQLEPSDSKKEIKSLLSELDRLKKIKTFLNKEDEYVAYYLSQETFLFFIPIIFTEHNIELEFYLNKDEYKVSGKISSIIF